MALEQVYYVTQIVAVVMLVISVFYLAKEVRQNTKTVRAGNASNFVIWNTEMTLPIVRDPELAQLWRRGDKEFEILDDTDKQRLVFFEWNAIQQWHNYFELHRDGLLPESQWQQVKWIMGALCRRQAVRACWKTFKPSFSEEFQDFISPYLE